MIGTPSADYGAVGERGGDRVQPVVEIPQTRSWPAADRFAALTAPTR